MLSTINETYLFQQDLLTVKMFPSIQQMGKCAATEVTNKICELLKEKAEINMIFAAAPSQNEFLSHLIHSKQIDSVSYTHLRAHETLRHRHSSGSPTKFRKFSPSAHLRQSPVQDCKLSERTSRKP